MINDLIYDKAKYNKDENENQTQYEDERVNENHSLDTVTFRRANNITYDDINIKDNYF